MYIRQLNSYTEFTPQFLVILAQSLDFTAKFDKMCIKYNLLVFSSLYNSIYLARTCYWRRKMEKRLLLFKNSLRFEDCKSVKETKVVVLLVLEITLL